MPPVGFEPTISAGERPHTYALDRAATGTGLVLYHELKYFRPYKHRIRYEQLNDVYSLPNIVRVVKSRRMRWAGHVARMGEDRGVHRVLVGKPEGKRPLGRPRRRCEDNIKMDLQEVEGWRLGGVGSG